MRRFGRWLSEGLLWLGAVLGAVSIIIAILVAMGEVRPLVFRSGSMEPAISTGALAFSTRVSADDIAVGDIVSVTRSDGMRVTHRVVETAPAEHGTLLTLKGDANPVADAEVYPVESAYRVMFDIPWAGHVVTTFGNPWVRTAFVAIVMALVVSRVVPRGRGGHRRGGGVGRRRASGRQRAGSARVAVTAFAALVVVPQALTPTMAGFTDSSVVTSGSISSGSVTKPAAVSCSVDNPLFGTKSLTTTWQASSTPTPLSYTAVIRETGDPLTITPSGANRSATVTGTLLGTLLGSTFHIDVTATLPGTSWIAVSTRTGTLVVLGLGFTCGAWS